MKTDKSAKISVIDQDQYTLLQKNISTQEK